MYSYFVFCRFIPKWTLQKHFCTIPMSSQQFRYCGWCFVFPSGRTLIFKSIPKPIAFPGLTSADLVMLFIHNVKIHSWFTCRPTPPSLIYCKWFASGDHLPPLVVDDNLLVNGGWWVNGCAKRTHSLIAGASLTPHIIRLVYLRFKTNSFWTADHVDTSPTHVIRTVLLISSCFVFVFA